MFNSITVYYACKFDLARSCEHLFLSSSLHSCLFSLNSNMEFYDNVKRWVGTAFHNQPLVQLCCCCVWLLLSELLLYHLSKSCMHDDERTHICASVPRHLLWHLLRSRCSSAPCNVTCTWSMYSTVVRSFRRKDPIKDPERPWIAFRSNCLSLIAMFLPFLILTHHSIYNK